MSIPAHDLQLSVEEYLRLEESSDVRHEYVSGRIFAMVGSTEAHNAIVVNLTIAIGSQIRGSGCRAFSTDMKLRVEATNSFYYPDVMVSCESYQAKAIFKQAPCLLIEVLSPSTIDIDRREKLLAYQNITSLNEYAIVYQEERRVELYKRRENEWTVTVHTGADSLVLTPAPGLELNVSLDEVYEGVL
ncbi:MAG TPA: Uma2 family endonuclease [Candidatus Obscuribacterales bacterium]